MRMFVLAEEPSVNKHLHSTGHKTCQVIGQARVHHVYDRVTLWLLNQEQDHHVPKLSWTQLPESSPLGNITFWWCLSKVCVTSQTSGCTRNSFLLLLTIQRFFYQKEKLGISLFSSLWGVFSKKSFGKEGWFFLHLQTLYCYLIFDGEICNIRFHCKRIGLYCSSISGNMSKFRLQF